MRKLVLVAAGIVVLGGCATTSAPPSPEVSQAHNTLSPQQQYIQAVNRNAKNNGVQVEWVNPPEETGGAPKKKGSK